MPWIIDLFDNSAVDFGWLLRGRLGLGMVVGVVMMATVIVAETMMMMLIDVAMMMILILMMAVRRMVGLRRRLEHV